jgi:1-deoxy-D-xylulose-5-phosphate synthase
MVIAGKQDMFKNKKKILPKINSPEDLKKLSIGELNQLATEIREFIIEIVEEQTGGHLASSLGATDIIIALHYVFNSPKDKFIWDVGHQAYAHKIITGRKHRFHTLRQYGGISGFPKPIESEHDHFTVGHAGTALAAAIGFAHARDLSGEDNHIIAIVGDGALTSGLSFEALNNIADLKSKLIVVLNDNQMSISPNIGSISRHLSNLRTQNFARRIKAGTLRFVRRIPLLGRRMARSIDALQESIFYFFAPTREGVLFEEMGFTYLGPYNGHNLSELIEVFRNARDMDVNEPILIHCMTRKGKGHYLAEIDATTFHGVSPVEITATGKVEKPTKKASYTKIFSQSLVELAAKDKKIVAITAAMCDGTGLKAFQESFPDRFFDVGIAEQCAVTVAAGMAKGGLKPVVAIYSTFLQRAYDQVVHDVCLQNLPVVFCLDRAGIVGEDGETHHGSFDLSYLRHIPNMTLMAPKDENELRDMIYTALNHDGPIAIRYPRGSVEGVPPRTDYRLLPIGKGEVLIEGTDLAIIAVGRVVYQAIAAASCLNEAGKSVAVINARFIKPIDEELIVEWAKKTGRIITVEENIVQGGFGASVLEVLTKWNIRNCEIVNLGLPDRFIEHGEPGILRDKYGMTAKRIYETVDKMLGGQGDSSHFDELIEIREREIKD